jgi:proteasome lid subunit RPN8/RPN11
MIRVSEQQRQAIERHGEETYPQECCGFLMGTADGETKRVADVRRVDNSREDAARHNRYLIGPEDFLAAEKLARSRGLEIVGVYHSHPDVEAKPSVYDTEHAWPWFTYIIVSVKKGRADHVKAWSLADDRSQFTEEELIV